MSKLAAIATQGKVYGIDHSTESVAMAMRTNKEWIDMARVELREASVSRLPFSTAPSMSLRRSKRTSGGPLCRRTARSFESPETRWRLIIIAEVYKGAEAFASSGGEIL